MFNGGGAFNLAAGGDDFSFVVGTFGGWWTHMGVQKKTLQK